MTEPVQPDSRRVAERSSWTTRSLQILGYSALFTLVFETAVRTEDFLRYGTRFDSPYRSQGELMVRDALGMHGRPDAAFEKWRMNNLGTRGPDAPLTSTAGTIRVLTLGASETFGLYESQDGEYPRVLEARLNALASGGTCPGPTKRFEVLNAAFPGMTTPTITQDVRLRLIALRPDVVMIYPTPMQYLEEQLPVAARPDSSVTTDPSRPSALRLRGVTRLRSSFKSILPEWVLDLGRRLIVRNARAGVSTKPLFAKIPVDRLDQYEADLGVLLDEVRAIGAEPVVLAHLNAFAPNEARDPLKLRAWERFYPLATGDVIVAFDSSARLATDAVARARGALFIDASGALSSLRSIAFSDYAHFNDAGASAFADTVAKALLGASQSPIAGCTIH